MVRRHLVITLRFSIITSARLVAINVTFKVTSSGFRSRNITWWDAECSNSHQNSTSCARDVRGKSARYHIEKGTLRLKVSSGYQVNPRTPGTSIQGLQEAFQYTRSQGWLSV